MKKQLLAIIALLATMGMHAMQAPRSFSYNQYKFAIPANILNGMKEGEKFVITDVDPTTMSELYVKDAQGNPFARNTYSVYPGGLKVPGKGTLTYTVLSAAERQKLQKAAPAKTQVMPAAAVVTGQKGQLPVKTGGKLQQSKIEAVPQLPLKTVEQGYIAKPTTGTVSILPAPTAKPVSAQIIKAPQELQQATLEVVPGAEVKEAQVIPQSPASTVTLLPAPIAKPVSAQTIQAPTQTATEIPGQYPQGQAAGKTPFTQPGLKQTGQLTLPTSSTATKTADAEEGKTATIRFLPTEKTAQAGTQAIIKPGRAQVITIPGAPVSVGANAEKIAQELKAAIEKTSQATEKLRAAVRPVSPASTQFLPIQKENVLGKAIADANVEKVKSLISTATKEEIEEEIDKAWVYTQGEKNIAKKAQYQAILELLESAVAQ